MRHSRHTPQAAAEAFIAARSRRHDPCRPAGCRGHHSPNRAPPCGRPNRIKRSAILRDPIYCCKLVGQSPRAHSGYCSSYCYVSVQLTGHSKTVCSHPTGLWGTIVPMQFLIPAERDTCRTATRGVLAAVAAVLAEVAESVGLAEIRRPQTLLAGAPCSANAARRSPESPRSQVPSLSALATDSGSVGSHARAQSHMPTIKSRRRSRSPTGSKS